MAAKWHNISWSEVKLNLLEKERWSYSEVSATQIPPLTFRILGIESQKKSKVKSLAMIKEIPHSTLKTKREKSQTKIDQY